MRSGVPGARPLIGMRHRGISASDEPSEMAPASITGSAAVPVTGAPLITSGSKLSTPVEPSFEYRSATMSLRLYPKVPDSTVSSTPASLVT